jgi:hypothetical protein
VDEVVAVQITSARATASAADGATRHRALELGLHSVGALYVEAEDRHFGDPTHGADGLDLRARLSAAAENRQDGRVRPR